MKREFAKLFDPIMIGDVSIKNRIVMSPMLLNMLFDRDGVITQRGVDFYVERAQGGVGLIVTSVFKVENSIEPYRVNGTPFWPLMNSKALRTFGELADYVHAYGSKIFIQLSPGAGRVADGDAIDSGLEPVSSSASQAYYRPHVTTRPLTTEEIRKIVDAFGRAAELVAAAEIDGIEVHGHEGYILDQFVTPIWNKRIDQYGGDLEGRLRFSIEVIQIIKDTLGKAFPVTYRYGVKHFIRGPWTAALGRGGYAEAGRDVPESIEIAKRLENVGVDALNLDAGCYDSAYWAHPPMYQPHGCLVDLVAEVKKEVGVPVIAVGKLGIPELALRVLEEEKADLIALGRPLLADPHWAMKVREGRLEDIRPCIGCYDGCMAYWPKRPSSCSVNPQCGRERLSTLRQASKPKDVLIAGGGVAGMEAARVAALRGHTVSIYEKTQRLGGHLIEAGTPSFKQDIRMLLDWYKNQLSELKVNVNLNVEVTSEFVGKKEPDVVIVATGSTPTAPEISGIDKSTVTNCCDLLLGRHKAGQTVVILGGGLEGCETALWLANEGKSVTVLEMLPRVMTGDVFESTRTMLLDMLAERKVRIVTNATIQEVIEDAVKIVDKNFETQLIRCDTVVLATGLKSEKTLFRSLLGEVAEVYAIGDCKEPRRIHHAIWEGYTIGNTI